MGKEKTPSFILELPLMLSPEQGHVLQTRFDAGRQLYNAVLGEALKRLRLMRQSKAFQKACQLPKGSETRRKAFQALNELFGFSAYALHPYAAERWHEWRREQLDSLTVQAIATRAFAAVQKYAFGKQGKPRFKGYHQFDSLEGKTNTSGIRWQGDRVVWLGMDFPASINPKDEVIQHGLQHRVKYVRLVRRKLNGKVRFYAQLVCEGHPLQKARNRIGEGRVGLDLGPSTIAAVGEKQALHTQFCLNIEQKVAELRRLQRKLDRQRRANNPDNYDENGQIKSGKLRWKTSNRMKKTRGEIAELHRVRAAQRASMHGALVNDILEMGNVILLEKVSYRAWQRVFGKSVTMRAPGRFVESLKRKAASAGVPIFLIPTYHTKLSQTCHACGKVKKKPLSLRVHHCECGISAQRDLYSAFLARCVDERTMTLDTDHARNAWSGVETLLRTVSSGQRYAKLARAGEVSRRPEPASGTE